jgi:hypothetical protein
MGFPEHDKVRFSLYNRMNYAEDFIGDFFDGLYSSPNGEKILARFSCGL